MTSNPNNPPHKYLIVKKNRRGFSE